MVISQAPNPTPLRRSLPRCRDPKLLSVTALQGVMRSVPLSGIEDRSLTILEGANAGENSSIERSAVVV